MLVLTRKTGETIQIDDDIQITVSEVRGGRVKLSIDAPKCVRIVRKEVLDRDFPPLVSELSVVADEPANLEMPALADMNCAV